MTPTALQSSLPAPSPAAEPCLPDQAGPINKQPSENYTPDATRGCAAEGPQSQHWRGLAPWSPPREADHPTTTTGASR